MKEIIEKILSLLPFSKKKDNASSDSSNESTQTMIHRNETEKIDLKDLKANQNQPSNKRRTIILVIVVLGIAYFAIDMYLHPNADDDFLGLNENSSSATIHPMKSQKISPTIPKAAKRKALKESETEVESLTPSTAVPTPVQTVPPTMPPEAVTEPEPSPLPTVVVPPPVEEKIETKVEEIIPVPTPTPEIIPTTVSEKVPTSAPTAIPTPEEVPQEPVPAITPQTIEPTEKAPPSLERPQITMNFERKGKGLVYSCKDKHWACVDKENYFLCKRYQIWSHENNSDSVCITQEVYIDERTCSLAETEKINQNNLVKECNVNLK